MLVSAALLLTLWGSIGTRAHGALGLFWLLLLVLAPARARMGLRALRLQRIAPRGAHEEDTVEVRLELQNHGRRAAHLLAIVDRFTPAAVGHVMVLEPGPLPGRSRRTLYYQARVSSMWGTWEMGPVRLARSDSLGLAAVRVELPLRIPFTVYPRLERIDPGWLHGSRPRLRDSTSTRSQRGGTALYLGVREYRPGDEPRRIHWPATARLGHPMVKEYEAELVPYLTLFVDLLASRRQGLGRRSTLDYLVRGGATILAAAVRQGHFVQLFGQGGSAVAVPPGQGEWHLQAALEALVRVRQDGESPLGEVVNRHLGDIPEGSEVVLLLGSATPPCAEVSRLVDLLAMRTSRVACVLVNEHSVTAVSRRSLPPAMVAARVRELEARLAGRGVTIRVLDGRQPIGPQLGAGATA